MRTIIKETIKAFGIEESAGAFKAKRTERERMSDERFDKILELAGNVLFGIGVLAFFGMYILLLTNGFN